MDKFGREFFAGIAKTKNHKENEVSQRHSLVNLRALGGQRFIL
jgi:hypothetical protein